MANKWTLKKKASIDESQLSISNGNMGLKITGYKSDRDPYALFHLGCYSEGHAKFYVNMQMSDEEAQSFREKLANELKPYVDEVNNKYDEILRSNGFVTLDEYRKKQWEEDKKKFNIKD